MDKKKTPDYFTKEGSYVGFRRFIDYLKGMQDNDYDVLIGVSSFKGFGKSTFSMQVCRYYIAKYMKEIKYNVRDFNAFDNYEVHDKINKLPEFSPFNCDEAVRFAMAEDFMRTESKEMKKAFTQIRTKHHIITFNIPDIWWIDKKYREGMMTIWIHIVAKGYAVMFLPDLRPGVNDRWHRKDLLEILKPFSFFTPIEKIMPSFRKMPTYHDEFAFPKIPTDIYEHYLKIREEAVYNRDPSLIMGKYNFISKLPAWNIYNRWDKISNALAQKDFERPSQADIMRLFYYNPISRQPVATQQACAEWLASVDKIRYRGNLS